ncbi:hypothetical protein [Streptomyces sp. NPDC048155]|uniref:hypothetical protein n=1 Tax=Streptomyces sp. NPDC048155 TaxID=3154818 RepID=UPI0033FBB3DE
MQGVGDAVQQGVRVVVGLVQQRVQWPAVGRLAQFAGHALGRGGAQRSELVVDVGFRHRRVGGEEVGEQAAGADERLEERPVQLVQQGCGLAQEGLMHRVSDGVVPGPQTQDRLLER